MKKVFAIIIPLAGFLLLLAQFSSCEKYVLPEMYLSEDSLYFGPTADTLSITVHSNVVWSFKNDSENWYKGYPNWGEADSVVMFTVQANESDESRQVELTIKTETISRTLHLFQEAAVTPL